MGPAKQTPLESAHMNAPLVAKPLAFIDLMAQRHRLGARIDEAVMRVINSGAFVMGPQVREFEQKMAASAQRSTASPAPTAPMRWRCR